MISDSAGGRGPSVAATPVVQLAGVERSREGAGYSGDVAGVSSEPVSRGQHGTKNNKRLLKSKTTGPCAGALPAPTVAVAAVGRRPPPYEHTKQ